MCLKELSLTDLCPASKPHVHYPYDTYANHQFFDVLPSPLRHKRPSLFPFLHEPLDIAYIITVGVNAVANGSSYCSLFRARNRGTASNVNFTSNVLAELIDFGIQFRDEGSIE